MITADHSDARVERGERQQRVADAAASLQHHQLPPRRRRTTHVRQQAREFILQIISVVIVAQVLDIVLVPACGCLLNAAVDLVGRRELLRCDDPLRVCSVLVT